jgi:hypothetical protein
MKRFAVKLAITLSVAALSALAVGAVPSQAVTTFGSTLANTPMAVNDDCNAAHKCTIIQGAANPSFISGGALFAPRPGVITRFRVKSANAGSAVNFRVLRPNIAEGSFAGIYTGADLPLVPGINSQEARVPVLFGDVIGLNCCQNASNNQILFDGGVGGGSIVTAFGRFGANALLTDGVEAGADGSLGPIGHVNELLLNADLEADADGDGFGDETQDLCAGQSGAHTACSNVFTASAAAIRGGRATLTADLPGTGTLSVGAPGAKSFFAAKNKKRKPAGSPFKPASGTEAVPKPTTMVLVLEPTGATKKSLKKAKKRLRVNFDVVYTPTGGSPSRQTLSVRLKKKKK